jgi:hypothetical protein
MNKENLTPEEIILNPFGTTFQIKVDNYLGEKTCTVKFPDRKTFYTIIKKISSGEEGAEYEIGEMLLTKGFEEGAQEFLSDDIYILMGALKCVEEFEMRANFLKKN